LQPLFEGEEKAIIDELITEITSFFNMDEEILMISVPMIQKHLQD